MTTAQTLSRDDPFYSPKYSISRGWFHVDNFHSRLKAFLDSAPFNIVTEIDADTGNYVQKIKLVKAIPNDLEGCAIDAAGNFRNALDQAMFVIRKETYFPFGKTDLDFENAVKGRCVNVPKEIINVIRELKPYVGGDDYLWSLNKLANTNKHGVIVPIASVFGQMTTDAKWSFTKNEVELNRFDLSNHTFHTNLAGSVFVGFFGIDPIEGDEAGRVLSFMGMAAESAVIMMEQEAQRLGIIDIQLSSGYKAMLAMVGESAEGAAKDGTDAPE